MQFKPLMIETCQPFSTFNRGRKDILTFVLLMPRFRIFSVFLFCLFYFLIQNIVKVACVYLKFNKKQKSSDIKLGQFFCLNFFSPRFYKFLLFFYFNVFYTSVFLTNGTKLKRQLKFFCLLKFLLANLYTDIHLRAKPNILRLCDGPENV